MVGVGGGDIEHIEPRLERIVAHVEKPVADGEAHPHAAGRMAIGAGLDRNAGNLTAAADRNGVAGDTLQAREHRHGRKQLRLSDPIEQPQGAGMIVVTMAQHHRIDAPDPLDIRQPAWLGSFAAVEAEACARPPRPRKRPVPSGPSPETALRVAFIASTTLPVTQRSG